jgi:phosphate starvation-inducible PhoH-like protein
VADDVVDQAQKEKIVFDDPAAALAVFGSSNANIKLIERETGASLHVRGNELTIVGDDHAVKLARALLDQLYGFARRGQALGGDDIARAVKVLRGDRAADLRGVFSDTVLTTSRARPITPKGMAQKRYVDAIREYDIVFGIGPAGTGKTYLAMAMAVRALLDKNVKRIILARPAVEAGEKLGFLPGSMEEKVNPYLRPLYDALHDMMDFERVDNLIAKGVIEVAPLAFMRGRAQPDTCRVLTHQGWREIGSLEVGDWVIGSNGRSTQVLGVYPQGEKEVFRLTATDGSSTLCTADHLWAVYTASDRRRGKPARVLETREMMGNLRCFHQHRYELPMLSAPVEFPACDVPIEPYALGLLLGDGCLTGETTPQFATADTELVAALGGGLGGAIEVAHKGGVDYVLRHRAGGRGGLRIANPVTVALRELGLCGTSSRTKFVPDVYLYNSPSVRLALLQGLLDTDGGPVTQEGRTCRIQYSTNSERLRDDVVFLVRSLGGVAYWRRRAAEGRRPGLARGRAVRHRSDTYVMDLRLPAGMEPFRLARKAEKYRAAGGGRPTRHVASIAPAGVMPTRCIRVAAPDSLYVTEDFLLTHNTLNDSFVILDEAQNTTSEQMKMFLTRLGFNSKAVVTGDVTQIDLPVGARSGLTEAREILSGIEGIRFCYFTEIDVVRHPLVQAVIKAYERRGGQHHKASPTGDPERKKDTGKSEG